MTSHLFERTLRAISKVSSRGGGAWEGGGEEENTLSYGTRHYHTAHYHTAQHTTQPVCENCYVFVGILVQKLLVDDFVPLTGLCVHSGREEGKEGGRGKV